jgi:hypothetical protein
LTQHLRHVGGLPEIADVARDADDGRVEADGKRVRMLTSG